MAKKIRYQLAVIASDRKREGTGGRRTIHLAPAGDSMSMAPALCKMLPHGSSFGWQSIDADWSNKAARDKDDCKSCWRYFSADLLGAGE